MSRTAKAKILLVEDSKTQAEMTKEFLERSSYEVVWVPDGTSAIKAAKTIPIDVMLIDFLLPDINGDEVCRWLKRNDETRGIPIIMLTVKSSLQDKVTGIKAGADDYLPKPYSEVELNAKIYAALRTKALQDELRLKNKRMEEAETSLRKTSNDWRITFDSTQDMILMVDDAFTIIKVNKAVSNFLKRPYSEITGRNYFDVFLGMDIPRDSHPLEKAKQTRKHEDREIHFHGNNLWVLASVDPIMNDNGDVTGAVHIMRDVTEQKSLQSQLLQVQKMESVGRLAGGVAHDFNNLLSSVIGYTELTLLKIPEEIPVKHYLLSVKEAAEKGAVLTQRLLAFSRKQVLRMQHVDLNAIIEKMETMMGRLIREDILLEMKTESSVSAVLADPIQIEQTVMNLMINARDAMPHGGKLTVEVTDVFLDDDFTIRHEEVKPGHYVQLSVRDTGIGMSESLQEKIFDPFFTTKDVGKGTGLGLSMVHGIVKQHKGYIDVYSEVGKGTLFLIYLPVAGKDKERVERNPQKKAPLARGNETVLVVDDDPSIRNLIRDVLFPLGYRLVFAGDGEEAQRIVRSSTDDIGVLLTDVIMPNGNGRQVADIFRSKYPERKIIFMSGYTNEIIAQQGVLGSDEILIQKPFSPGKLVKMLREVLDKDRICA